MYKEEQQKNQSLEHEPSNGSSSALCKGKEKSRPLTRRACKPRCEPFCFCSKATPGFFVQASRYRQEQNMPNHSLARSAHTYSTPSKNLPPWMQMLNLVMGTPRVHRSMHSHPLSPCMIRCTRVVFAGANAKIVEIKMQVCARSREEKSCCRKSHQSPPVPIS